MKKMTLLEQIKNVPNRAQTDLADLKKANLPLLLYGAGSLAEWLKWRLLEKHNIQIDAVVVDNQYYVPDTYFAGHAVEKIDSILEKYPKVDLIFAIHPYNNADKFAELSKHPKIANCFLFDIACLDYEFPDYYEKIIQHSSEIEDLYTQLEDDLSRGILIEFINAKISGIPDKLAALNTKGEEMYFPSFLPLTENEIFVDCGAYDGYTIHSLLKHTNGKFSKIYAFDPDKSNIEKLKRNVSNYNNIEVIEKGCSSQKGVLYFKEDKSLFSCVSNEGNVKIEVDTIDNIVREREGVSYIKMDIEGSELEALKGAKNTIISNKPKLTICCYHKSADLYTIPQYIKSLNSNYKLYFRHYTCFSYDLILYAIPENK
jgi:FkbM family methyltransferase